MTLNEYRQHLTDTLRARHVNVLVIEALAKHVPLPELSKLTALVCWDYGSQASLEACATAVRSYVRVLACEGKYVFDDEPAPLPSIHPEPWLASEPCGDDELSCDCGHCEDHEDE